MTMKTIGIRTGLWNNNAKSIVLLFLMPIILTTMIGVGILALTDGSMPLPDIALVSGIFSLVICVPWFIISYFFNEAISMKMVGAKKVDRKDYPVLYNLTENLAITAGIKMPGLYLMDSSAMNAFAAGVRLDKAVICVTQGLLDGLNKKELEAVLAHEISHIVHKDVRLLTIATIFVGIISFLAELVWRGMARSRTRSGKKGGGAVLIVLAATAIGYLTAFLTKLAISRKREFMADAGAVVLTKDKEAMIGALQKISGNSHIEDISSDMKFMLFDNKKAYLGFLSTHPPIEKRIEVLKNY
ncbi:MAG: M48 family metallopeptidase [Alphaproteobacteria bacterium]